MDKSKLSTMSIRFMSALKLEQPMQHLERVITEDVQDKHEVFTIGTFTGYFDNGNRRNRTGSSCKVSDSLCH